MLYAMWAFRLCMVVCSLYSANVLSLTKVTYQLDWIPGADKAPIYVGIHKGFFKEQGLSVDIAPGKGSTDALTKLAANRSDIGSAGIASLMTAVAKHDIPVKALFPVHESAPHAFMTTESSGINSTHDLKNRILATSPFTSSNVFLPLVLKQHKLEQKQLKLLKADASALGPMLSSGRADAIIAFRMDKKRYANQLEKVNEKLRVIPWSTQGMDIYGVALVASKKFLDQEPEAARKFAKAFYKSMIFVDRYPEESAKIMHQTMPKISEEDAMDTINELNLVTQIPDSAIFSQRKFSYEKLSKTWGLVAQSQSLDESDLDLSTLLQSL